MEYILTYFIIITLSTEYQPREENSETDWSAEGIHDKEIE